MSEQLQKLQALEKQEKELLEKKQALLSQRKNEIAELAERCNIILASDEIIAGLFTQLKQALDNKSENLQEWEAQGARFLKSKKRKKKPE